MTEQAVVAKTRTVKTLDQKLADATAAVAKYTAAIKARDLLNNVGPGSPVEFDFGRGEKKQSLSGVVTAVREATEEKGKAYRVVVNQGTFEEQAYVVRPDQITANNTPEPAEAETVDGEAPVDPLDAQ